MRLTSGFLAELFPFWTLVYYHINHLLFQCVINIEGSLSSFAGRDWTR